MVCLVQEQYDIFSTMENDILQEVECSPLTAEERIILEKHNSLFDLRLNSASSETAPTAEEIEAEIETSTALVTPKVEKTPRSKKRQRKDSDTQAHDSKWKSWSRIEETFLVGAVMERFFKRGSLSSSRGDDDCWLFIKETYDLAWEKYEALDGEQIPRVRSQQALSRHYKVMKTKFAEKIGDEVVRDDPVTFRDYFCEWEQHYNVNNRLVGKIRKRSMSTSPSSTSNCIDEDLFRLF